MFVVSWHRLAVKALKALPKSYQVKVLSAVDFLREDPFANSFPLSDSKYRRIRVGKYRVIIEVVPKSKVVKVLFVGDRKNVYK